MKKATITEAKNRLSAFIDGLKKGSPVLIVDRVVLKALCGQAARPYPVRCLAISHPVQRATPRLWRRSLPSGGALNPAAMTLALQRLHKLSAGWHEVDPSDEIRETAARFLRVHALRAADALQLAAAFAAAEREVHAHQHRNRRRPHARSQKGLWTRNQETNCRGGTPIDDQTVPAT